MKTFNLGWALYQGGLIWDICTTLERMLPRWPTTKICTKILLKLLCWGGKPDPGDFKASVAQMILKNCHKLVEWKHKIPFYVWRHFVWNFLKPNVQPAFLKLRGEIFKFCQPKTCRKFDGERYEKPSAIFALGEKTVKIRRSRSHLLCYPSTNHYKLEHVWYEDGEWKMNFVSFYSLVSVKYPFKLGLS